MHCHGSFLLVLVHKQKGTLGIKPEKLQIFRAFSRLFFRFLSKTLKMSDKVTMQCAILEIVSTY